MSFSTIPVTDLARAFESGAGVCLIDVRTPAEHRETAVPGSINRPLDRLEAERLLAERGDQGETIYVLCRTGNRSSQACRALIAAGHQNVVDVEGGLEAWKAAGLPVEEGGKTMSLERQVRIAAGSLVFAGALLAAFVNPWFLAVPAFVGAGLTFAGITDTCAMGMALARMPWNR